MISGPGPGSSGSQANLGTILGDSDRDPDSESGSLTRPAGEHSPPGPSGATASCVLKWHSLRPHRRLYPWHATSTLAKPRPCEKEV